MKIQMTDKEALRLAEKLANDDKFRRALEKDPQRVLARFHIELEARDLRKVARLPSKARVKAAIRAAEQVATREEVGHYDMIGFLFSVFPPLRRPAARTLRKKK